MEATEILRRDVEALQILVDLLGRHGHVEAGLRLRLRVRRADERRGAGVALEERGCPALGLADADVKR